MKTKTIFLFTLLFIAFSETLPAAEKNDSTKISFIHAFTELKDMMEDKQQPDFERAVFVSENAYHNNKYSYSAFQKSIDFHLFFIKSLAAANNHSDTMNYIPKVKANGRFNIDEILISPEKKKQLYTNALNNWAIFTYMNDTIGISPLAHLPFNYSSSDPFGIKDWSNSQVINLLASKEQQGNCFALTGFFKIVADRMETGAYICTAPQHIYIQHQDNKGDYYNVELATAGHPGDGMLQTLTYTTSTAIDNGIALRSYDDRQSIGLCLVNLAKSYEHKFNTKDDDFLLQCAETVLSNDSLNLNALLLKHQVLNERMLKHISENKTTAIAKLIANKKVSKTFYELEKHLTRLNRLGYIQMPMDIQEIVLNGFKVKEEAGFVDQNSKPFNASTGIPEDENHLMSLTGGLFQEVFEPKKFEEYGQFTFDTETKTIVAIDTTKMNTSLIDPVAFAYDFGARIYDPRLGLFLSVDPLTNKMPAWSPYSFCFNDPILFVDPDGRFPIETIWDVANVVWDIGKGTYYEIAGDDAKANEAWTDLGLDAGAMMIPYVPAGLSKIRYLDDATKVASGANKAGDAKQVVTKADDIKNISKENSSTPDFVVTKEGTAVPTSQERMREGFDNAEFTKKQATKTAEKGQIHTVPTKNGDVDVRTMEGNANNQKRAVINTPGTNSPRTPDGFTPKGTKQEMRQDSHFPQTD